MDTTFGGVMEKGYYHVPFKCLCETICLDYIKYKLPGKIIFL